MKILGIYAFYHDSAATLVVDGTVSVAAREERSVRALMSTENMNICPSILKMLDKTALYPPDINICSSEVYRCARGAVTI